MRASSCDRATPQVRAAKIGTAKATQENSSVLKFKAQVTALEAKCKGEAERAKSLESQLSAERALREQQATESAERLRSKQRELAALENERDRDVKGADKAQVCARACV